MIPEELAWTDTEACDDADHAADADVAHEGQVKLQQEREEVTMLNSDDVSRTVCEHKIRNKNDHKYRYPY